MKKQRKGITLISLVITIIVLIMLTAISVNLVFDMNLIETVVSAKEPNEIESIRERLELAKGSMYVDNKGKSSIDTYFATLNKEKIEPYIVTKSEKFTDYLGVVEVNNKYSFLIKFENNIEIEYEGKIEEIERKEQVIEIKISGDNEQVDLPVILIAEITENGKKVTSGKWVLNKESENIGVEEELYEADIPNENINLKIQETGEYYLHILTTDKYARKKETVKGPITISEKYHVHEGASDAEANGCYTTPVYHAHSGSSISGDGCYTTPVYHAHSGSSSAYGGCYTTVVADNPTYGGHNPVANNANGGGSWECCTICGVTITYFDSWGDLVYTDYAGPTCSKNIIAHNYTYGIGCGKNENTIESYTLDCGKTTSTITGYVPGCGKTEETQEGYNVSY